ncbi:DUF4389 domain-containing protein [Streptomyces sp. NPDC050504]|uniref:DUF4389 domain-containing protein n=1 Tax=Streptomyces sp. NPDC050504 TaxID=3365618 RepID=UPI003797C2B9
MSAAWNPRPSHDPYAAEWLPVLDVPAPGRQRRWTILLRWLLLLPHFLVLMVLSVVAFLVLVVGWFAALVLGRLPDPVHAFLGGYLAYQTRVGASATLLVDHYPPFAFAAPGHPVQIELRATPLNRLAVLFRIVLMIPAAIVAGLLLSGWTALSWVFWLIALVLGRLPGPVYGSVAAVTRYRMRFGAYAMMLTPAYPKRLFGDDTSVSDVPVSGTRPLVLSTGAKVLVIVFLLLGLGTSTTTSTQYDGDFDNAAPSHSFVVGSVSGTDEANKGH